MPGIIDEIDRKTIRALSIRQPYCHQILHEGKDIENRKWKTNRRGWFLIHASKTEEVDREFIRENDLPLGGIVGIAKITDCVEHSDSRWFFGRYGFVLEDAKPLPFIPYKGSLMFFRIDDNAWAKVQEAIRELDF